MQMMLGIAIEASRANSAALSSTAGVFPSRAPLPSLSSLFQGARPVTQGGLCLPVSSSLSWSSRHSQGKSAMIGDNNATALRSRQSTVSTLFFFPRRPPASAWSR